jgi:hypothetical protein
VPRRPAETGERQVLRIPSSRRRVLKTSFRAPESKSQSEYSGLQNDLTSPRPRSECISPRRRGANRRVNVLAPLSTDLAEWRLASGRPDDATLVFPSHDGGLRDEGTGRTGARESSPPLSRQRDSRTGRGLTTCATRS